MKPSSEIIIIAILKNKFDGVISNNCLVHKLNIGLKILHLNKQTLAI
jgi:hypothetical protein